MMHGNPKGVIVNHDLSLAQWLWNDDGIMKLNDFNKARMPQWNPSRQEYCTFKSAQSHEYCAPEEMGRGGEVDESADMAFFGKVRIGSCELLCISPRLINVSQFSRDFICVLFPLFAARLFHSHGLEAVLPQKVQRRSRRGGDGGGAPVRRPEVQDPQLHRGEAGRDHGAVLPSRSEGTGQRLRSDRILARNVQSCQRRIDDVVVCRTLETFQHVSFRWQSPCRLPI